MPDLARSTCPPRKFLAATSCNRPEMRVQPGGSAASGGEEAEGWQSYKGCVIALEATVEVSARVCRGLLTWEDGGGGDVSKGDSGSG